MALISHQKRLVFVHIERTGGMSITKMLEPYTDVKLLQHATIREVQEQGYLCPGYTWVAFVRNPFDRMASWYELEGKKETMGEYLKWRLPAVKQCVNYFKGAHCPVKLKIGRFETYEADVARLLGVVPCVHENDSHREIVYQEYYNDHTRAIIEDKFPDDMKSFGYRFEEL